MRNDLMAVLIIVITMFVCTAIVIAALTPRVQKVTIVKTVAVTPTTRLTPTGIGKTKQILPVATTGAVTK